MINRHFTTTDQFLFAYLHALGFTYTHTTAEGNRTTFYFENTPKIQEWVKNWKDTVGANYRKSYKLAQTLMEGK